MSIRYRNTPLMLHVLLFLLPTAAWATRACDPSCKSACFGGVCMASPFADAGSEDAVAGERGLDFEDARALAQPAAAAGDEGARSAAGLGLNSDNEDPATALSQVGAASLHSHRMPAASAEPSGQAWTPAAADGLQQHTEMATAFSPIGPAAVAAASAGLEAQVVSQGEPGPYRQPVEQEPQIEQPDGTVPAFVVEDSVPGTASGQGGADSPSSTPQLWRQLEQAQQDQQFQSEHEPQEPQEQQLAEMGPVLAEVTQLLRANLQRVRLLSRSNRALRQALQAERLASDRLRSEAKPLRGKLRLWEGAARSLAARDAQVLGRARRGARFVQWGAPDHDAGPGSL